MTEPKLKCEHSSYIYDWRNTNKGWPYKGDLRDPEYLKDRDKLFKESGNGWWWFVSNTINTPVKMRRKRIKKFKRKEAINA